LSGLVGDLNRGYAEIGWGNLFISTQRIGVIDFTDWYSTDPGVAILKR